MNEMTDGRTKNKRVTVDRVRFEPIYVASEEYDVAWAAVKLVEKEKEKETETETAERGLRLRAELHEATIRVAVVARYRASTVVALVKSARQGGGEEGRRERLRFAFARNRM